MPTGTMPVATATAVPPLEPPGVRVGSHGLRVMPRDVGLGVGEGAELRHRRLADDDRARGAQPADHLGVGGGGVELASPPNVVTRAGDVDLLLDRDRYAVQRAGRARPRPARRRARSASASAWSASTTENALSRAVGGRDPRPAPASDARTGR